MKPITLKPYSGYYVASGDSARRLSLFTGAPLVRLHQCSPAVQCGFHARCLAGIIAELKQSGYRVRVA